MLGKEFKPVDNLEGWAAIVLIVMGILGALWRQGSNDGKLILRVEELEKCKKKIDKEGYLTEDEHDKMQNTCRSEIYKDIDTLKDSDKEIWKYIDRREDQRIEERREDERRWRKMEDSVLVITTLLKENIIPKIHGEECRNNV